MAGRGQAVIRLRDSACDCQWEYADWTAKHIGRDSLILSSLCSICAVCASSCPYVSLITTYASS